jgi:hypothetical protein
MVKGRAWSWGALVVFAALVFGAAAGSALSAPRSDTVSRASAGAAAPTSQTFDASTSTTTPGRSKATSTSNTTVTGTGTCNPGSQTVSLTLSDMSPSPQVSLRAGDVLVVEIPPAAYGEEDTDVYISDAHVLAKRCSVLLEDRGRRALLVALAPGQSGLYATVTPPTQAMMPAWMGEVTVTK